MDGLTLAEQVRRVRAQQVVISPHGAQSTNLAFAAPCTVYVELVPRSYLNTMLLDLTSEVGVRSACVRS